MRRKAHALILALLALTSCRTVKGPPEPGKTAGLPTSKAERSQPLSSDLVESAPTPDSSGVPPPPSQPTARVSQGSSAAPSRPFIKIAEQTDPKGDAGLTEGPGYSDLVLVRLEDNGPTARIIVDMRSDIPTTLPADEVVGVGIDLYLDPSEKESEYQVFIDGHAEGWFAYLMGPQGFVEYPGTFQLGGRRMAFELPWSSLGNLKGTGFACFADWSKSSLVPTASEDHAPDSGRASFSR